MYRLLTVKRVAVENCLALYTHKKHVDFKNYAAGGAKGYLLQPFKYPTVNNYQQQAVYCQLQQHFKYCKLAKSTIHHPELCNKVAVTNRVKSGDPLVGARSQSTGHIITAASIKKKIMKPCYTKFIEVVNVTDTNATESVSRVKRLRAKRLQNFIKKAKFQVLKKIQEKKVKRQPPPPKTKKNSLPASKSVQKLEYQKINIETLDCTLLEPGHYDDKPFIYVGKEDKQNLHQFLNNSEKIQQIITSFHNFRDILESLANDKIESIAYRENADEASSLPDVSKDSAIKRTKKIAKDANKSMSKYKSKLYQSELDEKLAKERAIRLNLATYLNVCVSAGLQHQGLSTLIAYRQRSQKKNATSQLITIDIYNILLHGYAENGSYDQILNVLFLIEEDGLKWNEQTFAAIFECLGRLEACLDNTHDIKMYIKKAEEMNISPNQIMDKSKFINDQREITLDAIKRVLPDFNPIYTPPPLEYNNPLLNSLNEKVLPFDEKMIPTNPSDEKVDGAEIMSSKMGFKKHQLEEMAREQLRIELDGFITIKSIELPKEISNTEYYREKLTSFETQWRSQITNCIIRDLNTLKTQIRYKQNCYINYYTYLKSLDTSQLTDIILNEIYKMAEGSDSYSPTVNQLHKQLGQKVEQRYRIEQKKKNGALEKIGHIYNAYCEIWDHGNSSDNTRQMWQRLVHNERSSGPSMDIMETSWPSNILSGIGRFLYNILMRDIKIDTNVLRRNKKKNKTPNLLPALYTLFRNHGKLVKEDVKPHPVLTKLVRLCRQQTLTFDSNLVPMLCPPQPWSTPHNGGYLLNKCELIRLPQQAIQQWERINSMPAQNIYPALDALNQLASVPWRVNTEILDVIIKVFQNGGDSKLDVPQPPSSLPAPPPIPDKNSTISTEERGKLFREQMANRRKQAEMYSLWCDTLYRVSLANHYRDKVFWLPHNLDFRGRVYPVPPHLNHLGSDLARSILVFDQPQPLGVDGFSWLKLHCINLTGFKKRESTRERILYAEEVMPDILDSADNPLTGRKWWTKSSEPWQTLACCMEIANVFRSPNPEEYLSRFPIHQDGSCNGLQHYAALGRDAIGAKSVNLAHSDKPHDVYSEVVTLVEKARNKDAENGIHVAQALDGFVSRKVIKQTIMTTVYGVTRFGARLQIARQLKDIDQFPKKWVWPASTYLTTKTFESLREMFTSTREVQDWFTECARLISSVCEKNVEWITPLGLPVVQPYNKEMKFTQKINDQISGFVPTDLYEKPNVLKQKNAFPPNFIHSLDSSHMMLTSLFCERQGLTFVSVHDCFWTHACTVPDLNKICREQFVALHSQPILEDLAKFLQKNYCFAESDISKDTNDKGFAKRQLNHALCQVPKKGDFDLRNVLNSVYFFS